MNSAVARALVPAAPRLIGAPEPGFPTTGVGWKSRRGEPAPHGQWPPGRRGGCRRKPAPRSRGILLPQEPDLVGERLEHYRVIEQIGAGGIGVVYRARDERLGRDVALKLSRPDSIADAHAQKRLLKEAQTASSLNHPNICTIYDVGESGGRPFIAMEYVAGVPLSTLVAKGGLPADAVLRYGLQIAQALAYAHERGVIHRDLKPLNVMITPDGRAKVLDFGLAERITNDRLEEITRTQSSIEQAGRVAGTLPYLAPEVLRGEAPDARADIWALGVLLYEVAAGRAPFTGQTPFELCSDILREAPASLPPQVPAGLRAVIERCLTKAPALRYQRASEVGAALEISRADSSDSALPGSPAGPRDGRRLRRSVLATAIGLLLILVLAVLFWRGRAGPGAPRIQFIAALPL